MIKILKYGLDNEEIFKRMIPKVDVKDIVKSIIDDVVERGDIALKEYTHKFDKADLDNLLVTEDEINEAISLVDKRFLEVLEKAKENIYQFHINQKKTPFEIKKENGVVMGQKITPLERVGIYVPGGTASYPSTVLMDAIPALIAGVKEIIMVTPPMPNGKINPLVLAAAKVASVNKIFKIGGAQAIAALAYGTSAVPKVDKIVGPGNAFVAEAKRQVYGVVSIDMIAGPSEILIISDKYSNPRFTAVDLLSQAEHDKLASAILITPDIDFAKEVRKYIEIELKTLERYDIARSSIDDYGKIIITSSIDEAIDIANEIAPEHLELAVNDPFNYLDKIKNAGSIFLGRFTPEALGDYMAGPNHTLPTSGSAKFSSPLSVDDFLKKTQYTYFTKDALNSLAYDIDYFAKKEGLTAHARSAVIRFENEWIFKHQI